MSISTDIFEKELIKLINEAKETGKAFIDVTSKDLHRRVGGYPGKNHSMPSCCNAMRKIMKKDDFIKNQPPKGNGATLEIRYFIG